MNILFLDIEKTPEIVATYSRRNAFIPAYHIVTESFVPSISWAWNEDGEIQNVSVLDDPVRWAKDHTDDYHVIKAIHAEADKADVIVGHYVNGFDWKVLRGLFMFHDLPPIAKKKTVDTVTELRQFKFSENKLGYIAHKLGCGEKLEHSADMMLGCAQGNYESIVECIKYNNGDIDPMRRLYYKMRPYSHSNQYPDMRKVTGRPLSCKKCGSERIHSRGKNYNGTTCYRCEDCRASQ